MSVYRQARAGRPGLLVAVAAVALAIGVLAGALLFGGDEEPSLRDAVAELRDDMSPATQSLDALPIEYEEAVRGGRVVRPTEYEGARGHLQRARATFDRARGDLVLLAPAETAELERRFGELAGLVDRRAPAPEVEAKARAVAEAVRQAVRRPAG